MRIEHVAIWTPNAERLERLRAFYEIHFGARAGARYESVRRPGFASYFLELPSSGDGEPRSARIELMTAPRLAAGAGGGSEAGESVGYAHLALSVGSRSAVDALTSRLAAGGVPVVSAPRVTGDGYYEAVVRDPDGNLIEITA